jgi:UDP-glucuronate decarboxylase
MQKDSATPSGGTVLVAGGAGFIGSHLVERLLCEGKRVLCIDNLCTGSKENIRQFAQDPSFLFKEQDINLPFEVEERFQGIYNLASPASPVQYQKDPIATITTNVVGTRNLLEVALAHNAPFFQASTSEVYGDPAVHPQPETYWGNVNPIGPRACYDEGKRAAETLCFDYHRQKGVKIRVARIFNTYGPRMAKDDGRVVSNFIVQALSGEDITVYGKGTQTRSFQYVDDLVEGVIRLMGSSVTGPVNLGNPAEYTIGQLAKEIVRLTASKSKIVYQPLPQDDPARRQPDISLAKKLLGWEPKVGLEEGLAKTIEFFKSAL